MKRIAVNLLAIYAGAVFVESYTVAGLGSLTRVIGYFAFIAGIATMFAQRGIQRPGLGHVFLSAFVFFGFISVLWSVDPDMTLDRTWMYSMQLVFLWLVLQIIESHDDMRTVMSGYVLGAILACLGNLYAFRAGVFASAGRYSSTDLDPNEFALSVVLSIPMAWYLGFSAKRPLVRVLFLFSPLVMIPGVILTGSRGGAMSMVVALMVIPLCFRQVGKTARGAFLATAILAFVSGIALLPEIILRRLSSIGTEAMSGSMAGRREIWAAGWEMFKDHPILGVGMGGFAQSISLVVNSLNPVAHNTYLSVATELGVIGFLIYFLAVLRMGYEALRMPTPERWVWGTVLLAWMIGVFTLTWEHTKATWLIFALLLTHARLFQSEREVPFDDAAFEPEGALAKLHG